jgi:hypothetical protein
VKIRVRSGQNEAEVEADLVHIREAIALIPEIAGRFPEVGRAEPVRHLGSAIISPNEPTSPPPVTEVRSQSEPPTIAVARGDSLSDVITKFFSDQWGKNPRKLSEVREALSSYGLNYPKQSVAVALLRLAKSSKIRRFKSEGGEYVYTASTSMMVATTAAAGAPSQVLVLPESDVAEEQDEGSAAPAGGSAGI